MSLLKLKPYVEALEKDEQNSYGYRAKSSFDMLENVDLMIEAFKTDEVINQGEVLLDVFGLLQGFFVGIDCLYDLAIGLTHYKYYININQNKALHQLKYIRNDIVGHPTNRTYQQGSIGFSVLKPTSLTKDGMTYETYIYKKNKLDKHMVSVNFDELIEAYTSEKKQLIEDIYQFVSQNPKDGKMLDEFLNLYETLNLELVDKVRKMFMEKYGLNENSKHRLLWRLDLLEVLISWHDQSNDIDEFITYMAQEQVHKCYEMLCNIQNVKCTDLYTEIPKILKEFYIFIRKNEEEAYPLLTNLHDKDFPLHNQELEKLLSLNPKGLALELLLFLKVQTSEQKVYLIGSTLKKYRLKNQRNKK
ncbi:MAG: hypothetical protein WCR19_00055 [Acholeplasmataceae bacterium]